MNRMDNDVVISVENVTMAFNLNKESAGIQEVLCLAGH